LDSLSLEKNIIGKEQAIVFFFFPFPNYLKFHHFLPLAIREGDVNSIVTVTSRRR